MSALRLRLPARSYSCRLRPSRRMAGPAPGSLVPWIIGHPIAPAGMRGRAAGHRRGRGCHRPTAETRPADGRCRTRRFLSAAFAAFFLADFPADEQGNDHGDAHHDDAAADGQPADRFQQYFAQYGMHVDVSFGSHPDSLGAPKIPALTLINPDFSLPERSRRRSGHAAGSFAFRPPPCGSDVSRDCGIDVVVNAAADVALTERRRLVSCGARTTLRAKRLVSVYGTPAAYAAAPLDPAGAQRKVI